MDSEDNEDEKKDDTRDVITDNLGEIGRYQLLVGLLFAVMEIPHGWCMLLHKFISPNVDHWCSQQEGFEHWTADQWRNFSSPNGDSCNIYNRNYSLYAGEAFGQFDMPGGVDLIPCNKWDYDTSMFQNTIMQKFDLVCGDKIMTKIASFVFFAGTGVGVFIAGMLADRIGRKKTLLLFVILFMVSGLISAFASSFELWLCARFLWGASSLGLRAVKTVMGLELVGSSWRAIVCVAFIEGGWTTGYLSLALVSWLLPSAFNLQILVAVGFLPFAPLLLLITESPKWLLATGRIDECKEAIKKIMKFNHIEKEIIIHEEKDETGTKANFLDLFRTPMIRRNTIVISLAWFALGTLYFGLSLHMPEFNANIYLIFFLSGLVEIPADIIPFMLLNRFGRRPNISLHYIIGGLLCMATAAVPIGQFVYEWPIVVLAMCGKYISQVCWGIVYLYTSELFPTVIRSVALSFACSMARIGSMMAPFIAYLAEVHPVLPIFIFGAITFIVGLQTVLLPETNKKKLPDTLYEGEMFLKKHNPIKFCH